MKTKLILGILLVFLLSACSDDENYNEVQNSFQIRVVDVSHGSPIPNALVRFHKATSSGLSASYISVAEIEANGDGVVSTPSEDWDFAQAIMNGYLDNPATQIEREELLASKQIPLRAKLPVSVQVIDNPELNQYVRCQLSVGFIGEEFRTIQHFSGDPDRLVTGDLAEGRENTIYVRYTDSADIEYTDHRSLTPQAGSENVLVIEY